MLQPDRGSWTGSGHMLSCAQRGLITIAAGRKTTQNQHTCSSSQVPCLHTALPRHGHTLPLLQRSSKHSVLGTPRVHPPPSARDWLEAALQELCSPTATRRLPSFRQQSSLTLALKALTIRPLFSRVWLACLGCPCPGMSVQGWGEVSGGKSHLELGRVRESCTEMPQPSCSAKPHCFGMPSSPTMSCSACTHSFCWNKQNQVGTAWREIVIWNLQGTDLFPLQVLFQSN